jgi:glycyl-tRNA synthetase beta subunit
MAQPTRSIGEDLFKINEHVDQERKARDEGLQTLSTELHDFISARTVQDEHLNTHIVDELSALQGRINAETADRIQEDEAIVHAINEYTKALQDGLRIVSSS